MFKNFSGLPDIHYLLIILGNFLNLDIVEPGKSGMAALKHKKILINSIPNESS